MIISKKANFLIQLRRMLLMSTNYPVESVTFGYTYARLPLQGDMMKFFGP